MRFLRRRKKDVATLDITPLVDVVFLLNIFFLLTSSYFLYSGIEITVPSGVGELLEVPDIVVTVTFDGRIFFRNEQTDRAGLQKKLHDFKTEMAKEGKPDLHVLIEGDEDARVRHLVGAFSACKQVGIKNVAVHTKPIVAPPGPGEAP